MSFDAVANYFFDWLCRRFAFGCPVASNVFSCTVGMRDADVPGFTVNLAHSGSNLDLFE